MDVVPERDFLAEFIDSLINEEESHERKQNCITPLCTEEGEESDAWSDIAGALNQLMQKLFTVKQLTFVKRLKLHYRDNNSTVSSIITISLN